jgi:hypothetical protein
MEFRCHLARASSNGILLNCETGNEPLGEDKAPNGYPGRRVPQGITLQKGGPGEMEELSVNALIATFGDASTPNGVECKKQSGQEQLLGISNTWHYTFHPELGAAT